MIMPYYARHLKLMRFTLGMIGSKRKNMTILNALAEEGFSGDGLEKVNAPIGLEIDAETPEEIAVSIVAELIKVRAAILEVTKKPQSEFRLRFCFNSN